ncbi:hypothetical protein PRIPAC_85886 [Pristionchus pacificus]|uniref:KH domain-containing protein n=1 Tax=Pristionchus pacificus TaxID=54126 RepID=A0A2A6BLG3_PRIPA|nr:hypothetical protein PRIPAC_85886 [Pristionchus pacificus]|eukprot:PDM66754.1 hypothetical protein PRIPAC_48171 [Pristionchus pacificus]
MNDVQDAPVQNPNYEIEMGDYGYGRDDRFGGPMRGHPRGYDSGYGGSGGGFAPPSYGGQYGADGLGGMEQSPLDAEIQVVIREIHNEQALFEQAGEWGGQFKNAKRLLAAEADKLENSIDPEWLEVDIPKPIKVTKKILIPTFRHPRFNFVGKLLGPKGANLQAMAKQHKCHIYVLGRGSTKDRLKEQELLSSGDPQYAHYGGPLHVKVETIAPAHVAYQRIAGVLDILSKTLVPVRDGPDGEGNGGEIKDIKKEDDEKDNHDGGEGGSRGGFRGGRGGSRGGGGDGGRGRGGMGRGRGGYNPY